MADIQFRFSKKPGVDDDLKVAFRNVNDKTERAKQLIRLGLEYEAIQRVKTVKIFAASDEALRQPEVPRQITWSFPKEPSVRSNKPSPPHNVKANIMAGFD